MKICFYSPYLPNHFGGGEKHLFDVALVVARQHQVSIAISADLAKIAELAQIKKRYEDFFGTSLDVLNFISSPLGSKENFVTKLWWTKQFDGLYYVSDGSLFFSLAKKNYLHLQIPFILPKTSLLDRLKLLNWPSKNTNSQFTKKIIENAWQTRITAVVHPQVNLTEFEVPEEKKPYILNVGRFFRHLHCKRQDVLVQAFALLRSKYPKLAKDWQLIFVGSIENQAYFDEVSSMAKDLPITFKTQIDRAELIRLYQQASIYWHAAGYHINQEVEPDKVEHFGISTIEAMAAGAVPVVQAKGGQQEILEGELKELGWLEIEECVAITERLLVDQHYLTQMAQAARRRAEDFSEAKFTRQVETLFK